MNHGFKGALMVAATLACAASAAAQTGSITAVEWQSYQDRFVTPEGRVIDDANGDISHSEGQGYGMMLAYLADDQAGFERIWTFTRTELLLRDDGLAVWKWDPAATPHVTDANNASDGDLLIAYGLSLAAEAWELPAYRETAGSIADALAETSIYQHQGQTLMRPGVHGFGPEDRDDGPVINLSYWVFEALPAMEELRPDQPWTELGASGRKLIDKVLQSEQSPPPDWLSLRRVPAPASGFDPFFGYNGLRIPLYLMRAGADGRDLLAKMLPMIAEEDNSLTLRNVETGAVVERLRDPGYRIIAAMARCATDGIPVPAELATFVPTNYYPSTLHLLALAHLRSEGGACG